MEISRFNYQAVYQPLIMWPYPRLIAHRGGGCLAPENTLLAIEAGHHEFGFKAVEFDVMLSNDGVPMLMHDPILERTLSGSHVEYNGKSFASLASIELASLSVDCGMTVTSSISLSFKCDAYIPLFEDVIKYCKEHKIWMNVEIKPSPGCDELTGQIVAEMTNKYFPPGESDDDNTYPLFSSFSYESLQAAKKAAPHIRRGFLLDTLEELPDWIDHMQRLEAFSVHLNQAYLSKEDVDLIKSKGYGIMCYTVNDVDRAKELLEWGIDSFCTDLVDIFSPKTNSNFH